MHPRTSDLKLAVAAVVFAVSASFAVAASARPMAAGMHGPDGGMQFSERMLERLNATPEQRAQIRQIVQDAGPDMKAHHEAGRALREQLMQLFTQPTVDARAVELLRQQLLAQHDAASKRGMQILLETSRVLTPEQRKQFADGLKKRRDMMERHRHERRVLEAPKS